MTKHFDSFVVLANPRSGSNFLEANLNAMPRVTCFGEMFNNAFIGKKQTESFMGMRKEDRQKDPLRLLRAMEEAAPQDITGFRLFHDHDRRIFEHVLSDARCAKIVLTRNMLASYASFKVARATDQWKITATKGLKTATPAFDAGEFEAHMATLRTFHDEIRRALQTTGQSAFYIDYDDLHDLEVLNGLASFLGAGPLEKIDREMKRQNPVGLSDLLSNPDEAEAALAQLDWFALFERPFLEPRRSPGLPGFMAAREAPIAFVPLKSGPQSALVGWLNALGGFDEGLNRKALRAWQAKHKGARFFTVLRHPVARAHHIFHDCILSGEMPRIRKQLSQTHHGMAIPPAGEDYPSAAAYREGFLAFLKWLKENLSGQSALNVNQQWASQHALIEGVSRFHAPDLILREEELAEGLAFLCAQLGLECPPVTPKPPPKLLQEIYDSALEEAVREAYWHDYESFGFTDWCATRSGP